MRSDTYTNLDCAQQGVIMCCHVCTGTKYNGRGSMMMSEQGLTATLDFYMTEAILSSLRGAKAVA